MTISSFFAAVSTLLVFANPTPTAPVAATAESEYSVGVVAIFEDGSYGLIEERAVPADLQFETTDENGEATVNHEVLSTLLESRHAKTHQGKTITDTFSFVTLSGCSSTDYQWFVYKCYVQNVPNPFGTGCFSPGATTCSCQNNWGYYPCSLPQCSYLWIWCNNYNF